MTEPSLDNIRKLARSSPHESSRSLAARNYSGTIRMRMKVLTGALCFLMLLDVIRADNETCYMKACNKTAEMFSRLMNRNADPCDDFFNYTCGLRRPDYGYGLILDDLKESLYYKISGLLEQIEEIDKPVKPFQLLKTYSTNCFQSNAQDEDRNTIFNIVSKLGFDLTSEIGHEDQEASFDWRNTTKILADSGFTGNFLLDFKIKPNTIDSSKHRIMLKEHEYLTNFDGHKIREELIRTNNLRDTYIERFMIDYNKSIGNIDTEKLGGEGFKKVFDFQNKLIEISEYTIDEDEQEMTIKNLSMIAPQIPWLTFIQTIVESVSNVTINEDEVIVIENLNFIQNLEKLVSNTSGNVVLNYIVHAIHMSYLMHASLLNDDFKRDGFCTEKNPLKDIVPMVLAKVMTSEQKSKREYILKLSEKVRQEFLEVIRDDWYWMDEPTKVQVIKKLKSMSIVVVHEDSKAEMERIECYYDTLELKGHGYWSVYLELSKFHLKRNIEMFHKSVPTHRTVPYTRRQDIQLIGNMIYISPTGLRNYDVSEDLPEYLNFVNLGWDVAQMMASAVIGQDRIYDQHGNITDWWSNSSKKTYDAIVSCFREQYKNFSNEESELFDADEFSKALLQNLGFQIVHQLYQKWSNTAEELEWKLPNNYNDTLDQTYFISAGSRYCEYYDSIFISSRYIFQGVGMNFPAFSEAFSCMKGTAMNPEKRCKFQK